MPNPIKEIPEDMEWTQARIRSLSRSFAPMTVRQLAGIVQNGTNDGARVAAANVILDRAYGKAEQTTETNIELQITIRKLFDAEIPKIVDATPNATPAKALEDKAK